MIINFVSWQNQGLDSKVFTSGKSFMTSDVDFKHFRENILAFKILQGK